MNRMEVINAELDRLHKTMEESGNELENSRTQTQIDALITILGAASGDEEHCCEPTEAADTLHERLGCLYPKVIDRVDSHNTLQGISLTELYEGVPEHLVDVTVDSHTLLIVPEEHREAVVAWLSGEAEAE